MHCTYCGEHLESGKGLLVTWRDGLPRPTPPHATQGFCNERCLYKYLALQLREPQVAVELSPGRILRVLTESGDFLVKGDSWRYIGEIVMIISTGGKVIAEFPLLYVQGVVVEENFLGEGEGKVLKEPLSWLQEPEVRSHEEQETKNLIEACRSNPSDIAWEILKEDLAHWKVSGLAAGSLKSCPFCKTVPGSASFTEFTGCWQVQCPQCGCTGLYSDTSEQSAIANWNTRPVSSW